MPSQCAVHMAVCHIHLGTDLNLFFHSVCRHDRELLTVLLIQGNNVTIQMGNTAAASMDMSPLVEAFENMMSSVPQLQQLFQAPLAAQPGWGAQAGQAGNSGQAGQDDTSNATPAQPAGMASSRFSDKHCAQQDTLPSQLLVQGVAASH